MSVFGVQLFWVDAAYNHGECYFFATIDRDVAVVDDEEGVGAVDVFVGASGGGTDALAE